jgi:hypothetical protein
MSRPYSSLFILFFWKFLSPVLQPDLGQVNLNYLLLEPLAIVIVLSCRDR